MASVEIHLVPARKFIPCLLNVVDSIFVLALHGMVFCLTWLAFALWVCDFVSLSAWVLRRLDVYFSILSLEL